MKSFVFLASTISIWFLVSCNQNDNDEPDYPVFSGISRVDNVGSPISSPDMDDWTFDANWSEEEIGLFSNYSNYSQSSVPDQDVMTTAYPNPTAGIFSFKCHTDTAFTVEVKVVDQQFESLYADSFIGTSQIITNVDIRNSVTNGNLVRLYYLVTYNNVIHYKGHGDILIEY